VYAVEPQDQSDDRFDATGMAFAEPDVISFSPTTGLLDGQTVTLEASGLRPNAPFDVRQCTGVDADLPFAYFFHCSFNGPLAQEASSPSGDLTATIRVSQRLDNGPPWDDHLYCRDNCQLVLSKHNSQAPPIWVQPITMATGSLTASPRDGLVDGQPVTLTGTDLMSSYDGPPFWFFPATGGWGLAQCAHQVVDDPSIAGFFRWCGPLPTGSPGPIAVPGSDLTTTVHPRARIDRILGGTTDCTTAPDACVVTLARVEQDGSPTLHFAPISFATPQP
jgi:hypothetical protein